MFKMHQAGEADAEAVASLFEELIGEIIDRAGGTTAAAFELGESAKLCGRLLASGSYRVWLAVTEEDGEPAGFLSVHDSASLYAGGAFGIIQELYVRPAYRSHGLGRQLIEVAAAYAAAVGWKRLEVCTPPLPAFDRSLEFYKREGFEVTGGRKMKRMIQPQDL
ncbi:GCN5 family acetyltransferase [Paenibacillus mucilaginosus K02]|uniref:GCN5 family acetyltransferase n=1 Tax=Paenibacillus mucilaginosus K02 TaxID=997761 RepID=I0BJS4_9BACL|nr:GCN5 family acetyltransferase [Paenibacillus mucilaginosus K02]